MTSNGLLLSRDMHTLFDRGYLTINEELRIEVSKRIKEDWQWERILCLSRQKNDGNATRAIRTTISLVSFMA
ncbi:HNH endonuclease [Paenibacillus sp. TH7-28]